MALIINGLSKESEIALVEHIIEKNESAKIEIDENKTANTLVEITLKLKL